MGAEPRESEMKAAFLHTFAQFVSYPADRFQESSSPFHLCMFEDGSVTEVLERLTIGKRVGKHKILIKRLRQDDAVTSCHLLFVGRSAESRVAALLDEAEGAGVLTISELDGFCEQGGIVRFWVQQNPSATVQVGIRFEVNVDANERSRLRISSKVLRHARLMHE